MPTIKVSVTDELAEMVNVKVNSGLYGNASEVVREALRLMYERDRSREVTMAQIQQKLARGLQQAENGEFSDQSVGEIIAEAKSQKHANESPAS